MTGRSDSTLSSESLEKARDFDDLAWQKMVDLYYPSVYAWCRRSGVDEHTAADVSQEVFRSVAKSLHRFGRDKRIHLDSRRSSGGAKSPGTKSPGTKSLGAWIRTITRRRIADHFAAMDDVQGRGGTTQQFWMTQIAERMVDPASPDVATGDSSNTELRQAIGQIQQEFEPRSWQAFWLIVVQQRPTKEVAESLGMSANAIYLAKGRIMRRLTDLLEPPGSDAKTK